MDKKTPHKRLSAVKSLLEAHQLRMTSSASIGAVSLGLSKQDVLDVLMALTASDFYKSMTTYADHTILQDVYRPHTPFGEVYLKLTVINDVLVVSFKEL